MRAVIDRFEGDVAVLELDDGRSFADVDRSMLPEGVREGDALVGEKGAWLVDERTTRENLAANKALMDELFRD